MLATSAVTAGLPSAISDFVDSTTDGLPATYYAKVTPGALSYSLVITRDGSFEREFNDLLSNAQDLTLTGVALGSLQWADTDYYRVNAEFLNILSAQVTTPGSAAGDFVNNLDVLVDLLDPNGNVVATGPAGAVSQIALQPGPYYVRVSAENGTLGEYVLQVSGYTGAVDPFRVTFSSPPDGASFGQGQAPSQMLVYLSADVAPTSVQPGDLTVNGVAATGVTMVAPNGLYFDLPASVTTGVYQVAIAPGALTSLQNTPIDAFASSYVVDADGPRVIATSIQNNSVVSGGLLTYTVQFDEPLAVAFLDMSDVWLYNVGLGVAYSPTNFQYDANTSTLLLEYAGLAEGNHTLVLSSGDGAFEDAGGNNLDGELLASPIGPNVSGDGVPGGDFALQFFVEDAAPIALATPLTPAAPLGSLVYGGETFGVLSVPADVDVFTIPIEKNQLISVVVQGYGGLTPTVTLETPGVPLTATATAPGPNGAAVLSAIPAVANGVYRVRVQGAGGTSGEYSLRVVLNAALEGENYGGSDNGSPATAQDLDAAFLNRGTTSGAAAVLGRGEIGGGALYSESQTLTNVVFAPNVLTYSFTGAPAPLDSALLMLTAIADLDLTSEYLTVNAEGLFIQDVFVTGGAAAVGHDQSRYPAGHARRAGGRRNDHVHRHAVEQRQ